MTPICQPATEARSASPGGIPVRAQIVLAACGCAGASAFLFAVDPNHHAVYPQCVLYNTTGIYCAGCGATRALHALLHGRVLEALHDNALFVSALPLFLFIVGSYTLEAWRNHYWPKINIDSRNLTKWGFTTLAIMLVFMILRNLPGWPFEYLKPLL
jgi:hypothetical protein